MFIFVLCCRVSQFHSDVLEISVIIILYQIVVSNLQLAVPLPAATHQI